MAKQVLYKNPMGYATQRPANFPALDRSRVMRYAHERARLSRQFFATYREALAYGLKLSHEHFHQARCNEAASLQLKAARDRNIRQPVNRDRHWGSVAAGI